MILNLNKPIGWTSFDVCKKIKGIIKEKKVGHGGTLDPFAQGVLIVGTGKDTKELNAISNQNKTYEASILLGSLTDTLDIDGKITQKKIFQNYLSLITNVLNSFIGEYLQTPLCIQRKRSKEKNFTNTLEKTLLLNEPQ